MEYEQKHYKFVPCKTDDLGMRLEWENESDAPSDGDWNWWMDKDGNVEFARMKKDAYDHFYPSTKHLNLHETDWEPQSLSGYFKEIADGDVARGHRLTNTEATNMEMREIDNALKRAEEVAESIVPIDDVKYFCCGIDSDMIPGVYVAKGSLWFEDKNAGKLVATNDDIFKYNVIRLVFELETEFNYLSIRTLSYFNFRIEFDIKCNEIQLRLWRRD